MQPYAETNDATTTTSFAIGNNIALESDEIPQQSLVDQERKFKDKENWPKIMGEKKLTLDD